MLWWNSVFQRRSQMRSSLTVTQPSKKFWAYPFVCVYMCVCVGVWFLDDRKRGDDRSSCLSIHWLSNCVMLPWIPTGSDRFLSWKSCLVFVCLYRRVLCLGAYDESHVLMGNLRLNFCWCSITLETWCPFLNFRLIFFLDLFERYQSLNFYDALLNRADDESCVLMGNLHLNFVDASTPWTLMPFFTTLFGSVSSMILYVCFNQSLALSFLPSFSLSLPCFKQKIGVFNQFTKITYKFLNKNTIIACSSSLLETKTLNQTNLFAFALEKISHHPQPFLLLGIW